MSSNKTFQEKLGELWMRRNGTGTAACPTCCPKSICSWHQAMLDEILDLIESDIIGEPSDDDSNGRYNLKVEQRSILRGKAE
jgi:hypothetical protein